MRTYFTLVKNTLKLHHQSFIVDGHSDTFSKIVMPEHQKTQGKNKYHSSINDFFHNAGKTKTGTVASSHIDYQRLKDGGVNLQFMAIYTPPDFIGPSATTYAMKMLFEILYAIKQSKNSAKGGSASGTGKQGKDCIR
ncbi:MAG: hypothetical protein V1709_08330, partial [Planctomycetota bacterium]